MNDRDYRELQLSSTHLVLIFLSIIALGVVIFLLGISVGKKQFEVSRSSLIPRESITDRTEAPPLRNEVLKKEMEEPVSKESEPLVKPPVTKTKIPVPKAEKNRYYIQIGAYSKKDGAMRLAQQFQDKGYPTVIVDPLSSDRKAIFRVRVGGYISREEAIKVKQELLKITGKKDTDYFVKFVK